MAEGSRDAYCTAREVFLRYITYSDTGVPDVSRIFSQECFQFWLTTRKIEIKHPEQTYNRTLTTHIRGIDSRKPFPANIEEKLLEILRDSKRRIWDVCFPGNELKVGKYGFRHEGFHEKEARLLREAQSVIKNTGLENIAKSTEEKIIRKSRKRSRQNNESILEGSSASSICPEDVSSKNILSSNNAPTITQKKILKTTTDEIEKEKRNSLSGNSDGSVESLTALVSQLPKHSESKDHPGQKSIELILEPLQQHMIEKLLNSSSSGFDSEIIASAQNENNNHQKSQTMPSVNFMQETMNNALNISMLRSGLNALSPSVSESSNFSGNVTLTPYHLLFNALSKANMLDVIERAEKNSRNFGVRVFSPAVKFLLQQPVPENDLRFDPNFIFPPAHECFFDTGRPIGRLLIDRDTFSVLDANLEAGQILGHQLKGDSMYRMTNSLFELWYGYAWFLPRLQTGAPVWKRVVFRRSDNTTALFLVKCFHVGNDKTRSITEFQESLQHFPEYCQKPFLI